MIPEKTIRFWRQYAQSDPGRLPQFIARRLNEALSRPPPSEAVVRFGAVKLPLDMSTHALMAKYYFRTHEMFLERVFDRFLVPGQIFLDIGANCGYWSAYAASRVGSSGAVHMFEPVEHHFAQLLHLRDMNPSYNFTPNRYAVGDAAGRMEMDVVTQSAENYFNYDVNPGSNSLLPGFHTDNERLIERVAVEVIALDDYVATHEIAPSRIGLIKIDVEGFESFALDGMRKLCSGPIKPPILVEVVTCPERNPLLDGARVIQKLTGLGYMCLDATSLRPIEPQSLRMEENLICVARPPPGH